MSQPRGILFNSQRLMDSPILMCQIPHLTYLRLTRAESRLHKLEAHLGNLPFSPSQQETEIETADQSDQKLTQTMEGGPPSFTNDQWLRMTRAEAEVRNARAQMARLEADAAELQRQLEWERYGQFSKELLGQGILPLCELNKGQLMAKVGKLEAEVGGL